MEKWVSAEADFIPADVIRWNENIYVRRGRGKKARKVGKRAVIAEVLDCTEDGWVRLLVRASEITAEECVGVKIPVVKPGSVVKRAAKTVQRGKPERLLWSDESAREAVTRIDAAIKSRFTR